MSKRPDDQSTDTTAKLTLAEKAKELHRDLTRLDVGALNERWKVAGIAIYRFIVLLVENTLRTELPRRAASLTYTTILSLFPLLAVISSTASVFYTEERENEFFEFIERQLLPGIADEPRDVSLMSERERELYEQQKEFTEGFRDLFSTVSNTFRDSAGGIGLFGFLGLLIAAGILYSSIESVVNVTWQTGHRAPWTQTLTNFVTVIVFAPIIIAFSVTASGFAVALFSNDPATGKTLMEKMEEEQAAAEERASSGRYTLGVMASPSEEDALASPVVQRLRGVTTTFGFLLPFIPLLLNSLILGIAYAFLPKTRVDLRYALLGGFLAAALWEVARYGFFYYVYTSFINRTIASALGLSIVFLIWIYITWMILLTGNIIVFVLQNYRMLWSEKRTGEMILLDMRLLVAVMMMLARRFMKQGGGLTQSEIRLRLGLRTGEFNQIIDRLHAAGYVAPMEGNAWQVSRPPDAIMVRDLLDLGCHMDELPGAGRSSGVRDAMRWLQEATINVAGDMSLKQLVQDQNQPTSKE